MSAAVTEGGTSERLFAEASAVNTSVVESSNEGTWWPSAKRVIHTGEGGEYAALDFQA